MVIWIVFTVVDPNVYTNTHSIPHSAVGAGSHPRAVIGNLLNYLIKTTTSPHMPGRGSGSIPAPPRPVPGLPDLRRRPCDPLAD